MGDGTTVKPNWGTLVWTPGAGAGGGTIGYQVEGFHLRWLLSFEPILVEDLVKMPLDYIIEGGPILCIASLAQWDSATRGAMAPWWVSGDSISVDLAKLGKRAGDEGAGVLEFTNEVSGQPSWSMPKAVPLWGQEGTGDWEFRKGGITSYGAAWVALPPDDDSAPIVVSTQA